MPRTAAGLFSWRAAFTSKRGPKDATTRHVLLTLALWMDEAGGSCYPSQQRIADATGLHKRTVTEHLERADRDGWIIRWERSPGKTRGGHSYQAALPDNVLIAQANGEGRSPMQSANGGARPPTQADNGEGRSPMERQASSIGESGASIGGRDASIGGRGSPGLVAHDHPNSSVTSSENSKKNSSGGRRDFATQDEQPKHTAADQPVPESAWVRPNDATIPPGPHRLAILDEARERVIRGTSDTLLGGVRWVIAKQFNDAKRKAAVDQSQGATYLNGVRYGDTNVVGDYVDPKGWE